MSGIFDQRIYLMKMTKLIKGNLTSESRLLSLMLKEADIKNKSKIVELQMADKQNKVSGMESDFLEQLSRELNAGQTGIQ
jgi:hypothetical protein